MDAQAISDADLATVAQVAVREAWTDLSRPPERHGARTLDEQAAVSRFQSSVPRSRAGERAMRLRARVAVAAIAVGVLGACWWVSPTRTAIGLFGAGLFSLVALRRARRKARRPGTA